MQKSTKVQVDHKNNITKPAEVLASNIEAPTDVMTDASVVISTNDLKRKEVAESVLPFSSEKNTKPIFHKKSKDFSEKIQRKVGNNTFLNKKIKALSTEKNYEKNAKIAGFLGLGSLALLLIAYLMAGSMAGVLALIAAIAGIAGFFIGNKAYNHLEKGNPNRAMAAVGAAIGLLYMIGIIVGIVALLQAFQNFGA